MLKRLLSLVLCFAMILPVFACTGGAVAPSVHEHAYSGWREISPATCTEGAWEVGECSCGGKSVRKTNNTNPNNHAGIAVIPAVEPTEQADGHTAGVKCMACNTVIIEAEEIPFVKEHQHSDDNEVVIAKSTCSERGIAMGECDCGEIYIKYLPLDGDAHSNVVVDEAVAATPEAPGKTEGSHCEGCGEVIVAQEDVEYVKQRTVIKMWGFGDTAQQAEFNSMVNAFNASEYANAKNISIRLAWYSTDLYNQTINNGSALQEGKVDVIFVNDRNFKSWASKGYFVPLKNYTNNAEYGKKLDKMHSGLSQRFRLDLGGYTSYEDDPLWGVPVDTSPTALYYNRTALENAGVIVISVDNDTVTAANFSGYAAEYSGLAQSHIGSNLMDLWNENKIADKFGQWHDSCGNRTEVDGMPGAGFDADVLKDRDITVPKKGYYREDSENNYDGDDLSTDWINPNEDGVCDVVKVFNASIAMNWDETEDVAHLMTNKFNKNNHGRTADGRSVATTYGYYTEWWFNYGWSVGGDCLQDVTGEGTWVYGLSDWTANYLVTEAGSGYVGKATGKEYYEGDTLEYIDKLAINVYAPDYDEDGNIKTDANDNVVFNGGDILLPLQDGGLCIRTVDSNGKVSFTPIAEKENENEYTSDEPIRSEIKEKAVTDAREKLSDGEEPWFIELPSTKSAVYRYLTNISEDSKEVMPLSYTFSNSSTIQQFGVGNIAFVVERAYQIGLVRMYAADYDIEWGVAPLPVYKEYADPASDDTTVLREGVHGGHSEATALCIAKGSTNKDLAWDVIDWLTSDYLEVDGKQEAAGQYYKAQAGYIPNQPSLLSSSTFIKEDEKALNLDVFFDNLEYQRPGDWWYLPDNDWINVWATPLHSQVRNQTMTPEIWFRNYTLPATKELLSYSYFFGDDNFENIWTDYFGV